MATAGPYRVEFARSAIKDLEALPREARERIAEMIDALAADPRPPGVAKMQGEAATYRIRIGAYRVLDEVLDDRLIVFVVRVGHRKDVYRP